LSERECPDLIHTVCDYEHFSVRSSTALCYGMLVELQIRRSKNKLSEKRLLLTETFEVINSNMLECLI